jgi:hypothetical protein
MERLVSVRVVLAMYDEGMWFQFYFPPQSRGGLKSGKAKSILRNAGEGRVVAVLVARRGERKVRAPQGRVVGNADRG